MPVKAGGRGTERPLLGRVYAGRGMGGGGMFSREQLEFIIQLVVHSEATKLECPCGRQIVPNTVGWVLGNGSGGCASHNTTEKPSCVGPCSNMRVSRQVSFRQARWPAE